MQKYFELAIQGNIRYSIEAGAERSERRGFLPSTSCSSLAAASPDPWGEFGWSPKWDMGDVLTVPQHSLLTLLPVSALLLHVPKLVAVQSPPHQVQPLPHPVSHFPFQFSHFPNQFNLFSFQFSHFPSQFSHLSQFSTSTAGSVSSATNSVTSPVS